MISIEKATTKNIPIIQDIAHKTWHTSFASILSEAQRVYMLEMMYSENALLEQIEIKNNTFFLAKKNDETYGFISVEPNYQNKSKLKIHKLYILPIMQGARIGRTLMQKAETFAQENNQNQLTLNVNRFNTKALRFYENIGYKNIKSENIAIGNGFFMEDFVLEKIIFS